MGYPGRDHKLRLFSMYNYNWVCKDIFRLIFPKTRPRHLVSFDRSLIHSFISCISGIKIKILEWVPSIFFHNSLSKPFRRIKKILGQHNFCPLVRVSRVMLTKTVTLIRLKGPAPIALVFLSYNVF